MNLSNYLVFPKWNLLVSSTVTEKEFHSLKSENPEISSFENNILTVEQYFDFIDLLLNERVVYDNGKKLNDFTRIDILEEILKLNEPTRTELLLTGDKSNRRLDRFNLESEFREKLYYFNLPYFFAQDEYRVFSSWGESKFTLYRIGSKEAKLWLNHHPFGKLGIREIRKIGG